jgi:hypothetical protein
MDKPDHLTTYHITAYSELKGFERRLVNMVRNIVQQRDCVPEKHRGWEHQDHMGNWELA